MKKRLLGCRYWGSLKPALVSWVIADCTATEFFLLQLSGLRPLKQITKAGLSVFIDFITFKSSLGQEVIFEWRKLCFLSHFFTALNGIIFLQKEAGTVYNKSNSSLHITTINCTYAAILISELKASCFKITSGELGC